MNKTIGIVGGMGPLATCDLYQKIIQVTQADKDQEHVRVCIDGNTRIPDRTAAILHKGRDPLPQMIKSAVRLEGMGADVLIMPCNTAHYFYKKLLPFVDIPFLNMLEETADAAVKMGITKAGLLATDGTVKSGVYEKAFQERGISLELPAKDLLVFYHNRHSSACKVERYFIHFGVVILQMFQIQISYMRKNRFIHQIS